MCGNVYNVHLDRLLEDWKFSLEIMYEVLCICLTCPGLFNSRLQQHMWTYRSGTENLIFLNEVSNKDYNLALNWTH